jgi:putative pyruvate formate lyase activating enzyme
MARYPVYRQTLQRREFPERIRQAKALLANCVICPRECGVNRLKGELGKCGIGKEPVISSYFPHFGEESALVGQDGSGTIFIAGCNLQCVFCQNYETSHLMEGRTCSIRDFGEMMLNLQKRGCHNINIVTPSHVIAQLIEAVFYAAERGLNLPLVYNTSAYDSLKSLELLAGIVDIYMPDFKFFDNELGRRYTAVSNYAAIARRAIKEMYRQVGDLVIEGGIARRGLLVRHLVMPGQIEDSCNIFNFIADEVSKNTYLNIMPQYRPAGEAHLHEEIADSLVYSEYIEAVNAAKKSGLQRLDKQLA